MLQCWFPCLLTIQQLHRCSTSHHRGPFCGWWLDCDSEERYVNRSNVSHVFIVFPHVVCLLWRQQKIYINIHIWICNLQFIPRFVLCITYTYRWYNKMEHTVYTYSLLGFHRVEHLRNFDKWLVRRKKSSRPWSFTEMPWSNQLFFRGYWMPWVRKESFCFLIFQVGGGVADLNSTFESLKYKFSWSTFWSFLKILGKDWNLYIFQMCIIHVHMTQKERSWIWCTSSGGYWFLCLGRMVCREHSGPCVKKKLTFQLLCVLEA